ncbi:ABC transporter permease [Lacrimispora sp. NSJ-141]|uniref:ABC transporter permease n=1 Tax=Lientehia hominis TaxID=2897778 RepID=A0AAP2RL06_9FIRM|nr:ABC transporter permease [Lientehia hominis]MCD2492885.1 ABC transporter permease [Lientehia hominis]
MFISLFWKECRQIGKSIVYYAFLACLILFFMSQLGEESWNLAKPQPGQEEYGRTYSKDEQTIMNRTLQNLSLDYVQNRYTTYPLGFYKKVVLGEKKMARMEEIMGELIGVSREELGVIIDDYINEAESNTMEGVIVRPSVSPAEGLTYERFLELMEEIDGILGGHSTYAPEVLKNGTIVSQTYEGALEEYRAIVEKDRYTGAYARLFCDYMGLMLSILPVFLAVARTLKDKRSKASQVIYSKQASSGCVILSRYLAALFMTMLPVIAMAAAVHIQCGAAAVGAGIAVDHLAFVKYVGGWLFPTVAFTLAAGFLISELTESVWAVLIQGIFWFFSVFQSFGGLNGNFGLKFIPRFNDFGNTELFFSQLPDLIVNRIFYGVLTAVLVLLCIGVYTWKRKGGSIRRGKLRRSR